MGFKTFSAALAASVLLVSPLVSSQAWADRIGAVASLTNTMSATAPDQSRRSLGVGSDVVANDEVRTNQSSRGQLMFVDETTLSVAPNSQIVLDRFIYDPSGGDATMGLRLTQGALRFIGGATSEGQEATIETPTATLGIRGSTALVSFLGGRTVAIFLMGDRMCVSSGGQRQCTSRQGGVLTEDGYIGIVSSQYLAELITRIDGAPPSSLVRRNTGSAVDGNVSPQDGPVSTQGGALTGSDPNRFFEDDVLRGILGSPTYRPTYDN